MQNFEISVKNLPDLNEIHQNFAKITQFLIKNQLSITTMESCTSGFIASLITDSEGSSAIFKGANITYSNEAKIKQGVSDSVIKDKGVYSVDTALSMADAVLKTYPSDIAIGITGSFGNVDPNNKDSIPGTVFIAFKLSNKIHNQDLENTFTSIITLPTNITRFDSKLCVAKVISDFLSKLF